MPGTGFCSIMKNQMFNIFIMDISKNIFIILCAIVFLKTKVT
jgi:hypothetical protein